jgi:hypothetical protein
MGTMVRLGGGLLLLAVVPASPVRAQVELEASALAGATWRMSEPPSRFAIRSDVGDIIVTDSELDTRPTFGAILGVTFGDSNTIEALFSWAPMELTAVDGLEAVGGETDADVLVYSLTVLHHFAESGPFKPFFGLGAGAQTTRFQPVGWRSETEPMVNLIAGGLVELRPGLSLRLDARNCISAWASNVPGVDNAVRTDAVFSAGFTFTRPVGD